MINMFVKPSFITNCRFMIIKPSKWLTLSFILMLISALLLLMGRWRSPHTDFQEQDLLLKQARHPLVIHGFQYAGYHQGEKNIGIKAVRHSIEKKKIGFFTSGVVRIAKFKGAEIDIYTKQVESKKKWESDSQKPNYSLNGIFTKGAMPAAHLKNVVSFIFEPVKINFHIGKSLITRIQANRATVKSKDRSIDFQGQVLVTAESSSLTTNKLTFVPDSGLFKTDSHFVYKTSEKQITGENLTADLSLNLKSL